METVNHPGHYQQRGREAIDLIKDMVKGEDEFGAFCLGNAIKYLTRYRWKNGHEDLMKAIEYIKLLEHHVSGSTLKKVKP